MIENYYRPYKRRRLKPRIKRTLIIILLLIVACIVVWLAPWDMFASSVSASQTSPTKDTSQKPLNQIVQNTDSDIIEAVRFDKTVNAFIKKWDIVGASLAIMKDGNLIYSKGYGYANKERGEPMEVKHIMRIASVSKLITATAIMYLCDQGRLSLDSKVFGVKGILNQFKGYTDSRIEKITIEQLLRHEAGFTVRAGDPMFDAARMGIKQPISKSAMVKLTLKRGLGYTPGDRSRYSNVGYLILSQVVERLTVEPYEQFVKDSILAPIGCTDMHIGSASPQGRFANEVCYYEDGKAEPVVACNGSGKLVSKSNGGNDIALLSGAGGWVCSPVELLRLIATIDHQSPHRNTLSRNSILTMTRASKGESPIGWSNVDEKGNWWRSGSMAGTSAMLRRQNNGYTWVFVTNTSSWKGARFPRIINSMMQNAFSKVTEWPEKDLFSADSLPEGQIESAAQ